MKNKNNASVSDLENDIESGLITSREYSNPGIFLPMNPVFRFIKKMFLYSIKMYTKYQIVFNYNILHSVNKIYQYIIHLQADQEDIKTNYKVLFERIKLLEKKLKKT
jgi:hypothetical protein